MQSVVQGRAWHPFVPLPPRGVGGLRTGAGAVLGRLSKLSPGATMELVFAHPPRRLVPHSSFCAPLPPLIS